MQDEGLETAWQRVLENWEEAEAHAAFISLCTMFNRLDEGARRYREIRTQDPSKDAIAKRELDKIVALSLTTLRDVDAQETARLKRIGFFLYLFILLAVGGIVIWILGDVILRGA